MRAESAGERRRFAGLLAACFLALTVPRLLLHELWRDEAWLWLVVGETDSFAELFAALARSGQGYLFPLLCDFAHRISSSPRGLQLLHLALATAAAWAFVRWAPLGRRERALFVFGYFPCFEYAVISRHYAAGALLLWLACAAARSRRPALALGAALGLLCQTTVYGYILALAVAGGWLVDRRLRPLEAPVLPRGEAVAGLAMALAGAVAGLVQLVPLSGTSFAPWWRLAWDAATGAQALRMPWRAMVPLALPKLHFWNTNLLDSWPAVQSTAGALALALAVALLWRRKTALATFGLGAAGLFAFGYLKLMGQARYDGHWWLLLGAAIWLGGGLGEQQGGWRWRSQVLVVLLAVHIAAAAFASWMDLRHPFSNAAATAELLRRGGLDRTPLLGYREPPSATVALALGQPLFAPSRGIFTTHPDWGPLQRDLRPPELRCAARELARREGRDIVLVVNHALPAYPELLAIGARLGAIVGSEDYYLYRLRWSWLEDTAAAAACDVRRP